MTSVLVPLPFGDPVLADFLEAAGHVHAAMIVRGVAAGSLLGVSDAEMDTEMRRRERARHDGRCDVCGAWYDEPTCGSPRHADADTQWYRRWRFEWGSSYLHAHQGGKQYPSLSVSRYGVSVRLYGQGAHETTLPVDYTDQFPRSNLRDVERLRWAIDWAIGQLS